MKKILVPSDFSGHALEAYQFAIRIAKASGGEVLVLKVIDLPFLYEVTLGMQPAFPGPEVISELEEQALKSFRNLKEQFPENDVPVYFTSMRGNVSAMILRTIEEEKIDLVVMGTRGASSIQALFAGSNTEKVVRTSPVPVISVPKSPASIESVRNIVFPSTLELDQDELLDKVKKLQKFFNAKLQVLVINTPSNLLRSDETKTLQEQFASHYELENFTMNSRNDFFEHDGIINFALDSGAELIAMGTHGRRGFSHLLKGSVAEDVVNHTEIPVWTFGMRKD